METKKPAQAEHDSGEAEIQAGPTLMSEHRGDGQEGEGWHCLRKQPWGRAERAFRGYLWGQRRRSREGLPWVLMGAEKENMHRQCAQGAKPLLGHLRPCCPSYSLLPICPRKHCKTG